MDKLGPVIDFFKKYGFWMLSAVLAFSSIGVWVFASGQVDSKNKKLTSEIESNFKTGNTLRTTSAEEGISAHANTASEEGMQKKIDEVTASVVEAWRKRHAAQAGLMKWPEEIQSQNAQFVTTFKKFDPPEAFPDDYEVNKMLSLLEIYKVHIPKSMERICKIIGADWQFADEDSDNSKTGDGTEAGGRDPEGRGGGDNEGSGTKTEDEARIICEWHEENQTIWESKLTQFEERDDNTLGDDNIPTPSQIYMLQQDLWLMEGIFTIIRDMNSRETKDGMVMVKANDLANIKRVDHIAFGREALTKLGEITEIAEPEADSGGTRNTRGGNARGGKAKEEDNGYGEIDYNGQPAFHGRYVDERMTKFYEAEEVKKALKPGALPAGEALEMLVAKRVPVRLAVKINETKIPEFIAACENSPFAIKIWQVRVNKHEPNEGIVHQGGNTTKTARKKKKPRRSLNTSGGFDGNTASSAVEFGPVETRTNYDVKAEFFGYAKIYNPVNEERLTGKSSDADADADGDADAADGNPNP